MTQQADLTSIMIRPKRGIFNATVYDGSKLPDIIAQATIEEEHFDQLEITQHPVEFGAAITDHAFKQPSTVQLRLGWSASRDMGNNSGGTVADTNTLTSTGIDSIKAIYDSLIKLQTQRALFTLYTGKRKYDDMLVKVLSTESDFETENSLPITMVCQQVILVNTSVVSLSSAKQEFPEETSSLSNTGTVQAKPKSLQSGIDATGKSTATKLPVSNSAPLPVVVSA